MLIPLKNKFDILELLGQKGELSIVSRSIDEQGKIITQYEKNGYTFAVRL